MNELKTKKKFPKNEDFNLLFDDSGWGTISNKTLRSIRKSTSFAVCVYDDKKIVGMGRVVGDGLHYNIYDIVVLKSYQGKKIGTMIMNSILDWFKSLPEEPLLNLGATSGKEGFYENFGFKCRPYKGVGAGMKYNKTNTK